jgi:hypothetical protein
MATTAIPTTGITPITSFGLHGSNVFANLFAEGEGQRNRVLDVADAAVDNQLGAQSAATAAGLDTLNRKATVFNPVENKIATDAMAFDGEAEGARLASEGSAAVGQNFSNARRQVQSRLSQMGISPASGRTGAVLDDLGTAEAVARAGAETVGRVTGRDVASKRLLEAAGVGSNVAAQGNQLLATGTTAGTSAVSNIQVPSNVARADANLLGNGLEFGMKGLTTSEGLRLQEKGIDNNFELGKRTQDRADDAQDADDISGIISGIGTIFDIFGG